MTFEPGGDMPGASTERYDERTLDMPDSYDVVVVGAGTGGYSCAFRAGQLGLSTVLVEKDERLGGTCLIRGCIPTKALLQSAAVMDEINRSQDWGIKASGEPDWASVQSFKDKVVDKLTSGLGGLAKARKVEVVRGQARFAAQNAVEVDGRRIEARHVVVATGSYPKLLPEMEVTERIITSDQALQLDRIPSSVVVIGAGAVGLEFASLYRSFGAEVTLVEALPRLAPLEDEDISKEVARAFRKRNIANHADAKVQSVQETDQGVSISIDVGREIQTVEAELCLVAVGRGPVTEGVGLEELGVQIERGYVKVNGQMQTSVDGMWAIGDVCTSPFQLAHVSMDEGVAVAERISGQEVPELDYAGVPRVTFSSPEIASVGLTEAQARERGHEVEVEKLSMQGLGKANILGEGGTVKLVAQKDGPVLGIHLIGPHVTDLVAEAMLITNWEAIPAEVAALIHPHPTLTEAIGEAHLALAGKPLHTP
jgi:dihydrolipoyl dehydrogenase